MKTTFRSKFLLAALAILALSGAAIAQDTAAPGAEKLALAKQYIATVPVEDDIRAAVEQLSASIRPEQRVLFRSIAANSIDYDKLRNAAERATAEMFTESEIKAMTAFYGSPEGQSVRTKMIKYEEKMQPVVVEVLQAFVLKLQENNISIESQIQ